MFTWVIDKGEFKAPGHAQKKTFSFIFLPLYCHYRHVDIVIMLQELGGTVYLETVRIGMELCKSVVGQSVC